VSCSQLFTLIAMRCFSLSTPGTTDQHPHSVPSLSFLDSLLTLGNYIHDSLAVR
jgi:hypothetical protein